MEKRLIDRFTEDFESELSNGISREETFNRARKKFEDVCGFTPYRNLKSYNASRYKSKNRFR